jgi:hypothetical protein
MFVLNIFYLILLFLAGLSVPYFYKQVCFIFALISLLDKTFSLPNFLIFVCLRFYLINEDLFIQLKEQKIFLTPTYD